ncbi:polymer-forming cytoskeletal protein [Shewanella sp. 6_MG-2023]|uniref:bactofilin family protein n=1 Tax=Shewanella sp. 6_MG-2023 TaxID=3062660 RepID=UPI0026E2476A|nr:polymer-forming cytoskeletal protein [Shewanella sp. 6_MG-2023]MDO6620602.1 polymer-forming cytoskeletal protein [Shewanella sp. 6_MG-2023]
MFSKKSPTSNLSFIANDCELSGNIKVNGDVLIAGKVDGEIRASGNITVEATGVVTGGVVCVEATVSGLMTGNINCEKLTISNTGTFDGEVYSKRMEILDNGQFLGYRKAYDKQSKALENNEKLVSTVETEKEKPQLTAAVSA